MSMDNAVPIFSKDYLLYFRDEKEGYMTLISKEHPETMELIINPTSKQILELCNGKRTISDIYKTFEKWYPQVSKKKLHMDIIKALSNFSRLGIIKWEGKNPFVNEMREEIDNNIYMLVGYEEHFSLIMNFLNSFGIPQQKYNIAHNYYFYLNPLSIPNHEYRDVAIRQKLFSYSEEFFLIRRKDKTIGLITVSVPIYQKGKSKAGVINLIVVEKKNKILDYAFDYILRIFPIFSIVQPTKIKIFLEKEDDEIIAHLKEKGFKLEGKVKNEIDFDKNLVVYSYYYVKKFIENLRAKQKIEM